MWIAHRFTVGQVAHFSSRPGWQQRQHVGWHSKPGQQRNQLSQGDPKRPSIITRKMVRYGLMVAALISLSLLIYKFEILLPAADPTPLLVIGVSEYQSPMPLNSFVKEDVDRFRQTFTKNIRLTAPEKLPEKSNDFLQEIEKYLNSVKSDGPKEKVVLIYLSLHGVVNAQGQPCLLLPDHDPLDCTTWLPIRELFNALTEVDRTKDWKKVLLLDAGRIDDCWEMGILCNTFAIALQDYLELEKNQPENCFVISATSGLDAALTAPEISGTPFGYYVAAGLRGAADSNDNSQVSLAELQTYVCSRVDQWANSYREVAQRPFFYGGNGENLEELELAHVKGNVEFPTHPWKLPIEKAAIDKCVGRMQLRCGDKVWQYDPLKWARAQILLQRLDAELLGGDAYADKAKDTLERLNNTLNDFHKESTYHQLAPISLAMQQNIQADCQPAALRDQLTQVWEDWINDSKIPKEAQAPQQYERATAFTWDRLVRTESPDGPLDKKALTDASQFCDAAEGAAGGKRVEMVEIALLRLLNGHIDWGSRGIQGLEKSPLLRLLLRTRQQSETLAAPIDPRQHYAIALQLAQVDQQLAFAFDQVLVGSDVALGQAKALIENSEPDYRPIKELSELTLRALQVRDQSLATSLHLTRWLVRKAKLFPAQRSGLSKQMKKVDLLVEHTRELAEEIDRLIQQPPSSLREVLDETELFKLTNKLVNPNDRTGYLDILLRTYEGRTKGLVGESGSVKDWEVELPQHLQSPISIDKNYCTLHSKWFDSWSKKLTNQMAKWMRDSIQQNSLTKANEIEKEKENKQEQQINIKHYLRWLTSNAVPPFTRLFDGGLALGDIEDKTSLAEIAKKIAAHGGKVRKSLSKASRKCDDLSGQTAKDVEDKTFAEARSGLSQADYWSRGLAPLLPQFTRHDYTKELRELDVHSLLVWRGQRLLNDFWGGWGKGPKRYFQTATAHLLRESKMFFSAAGYPVENYPQGSYDAKSLAADLDRVLPLFDEERESPLLVNDLALDREHHARQLSFDTEANKLLPVGIMTVYLSDTSDTNKKIFLTNDQSQDAHRCWSLPTYSKGADPPTCELTLSNRNDRDMQKSEEKTRLVANSLFRGHQWIKRFNIVQGQSYEWVKPKPESATLVVEGGSQLTSKLIIIFDCSDSMNDPFLSSNSNRINLGKQALITTLSQLKDKLEKVEGQYRVGLMFYGRRAGFKNLGNKKDSNYVIEILEGERFKRHPADDVEYALEPKVLNDFQLKEIDSQLNNAKARGITPLYLAIKMALEKYGQKESTHILVITDGEDTQSVKGSRIPRQVMMAPAMKPANNTRTNPSKKMVEWDDITKLHETRPAQVDAIFIGDPNVGLIDLKKICQTSGGSCWALGAPGGNAGKNPQEILIEKLQESLQLLKYRLNPNPSKPGDQESFDLGEEVRLPPPSKPMKYEVSLEGVSETTATIWVEGGEALELNYNHSKKRFEHAGYYLDKRGKPQGPKRNIFAQVHKSKLDKQVPVFRISVQTEDKTRFSRRPEVVWAKVHPKGDHDRKKTYYFIDQLYEPNRPVPMLQFHTPGWPEGAEARIELCLAMPPGAGLVPTRLTVPELDEKPVVKKLVEIGGALLDIRFEHKPADDQTEEKFLVIVKEKHIESKENFPLHLQISPPPDSIEREFYASDLKAHHTFIYETKPENPKVLILNKQVIEKKGSGLFIFDGVAVSQ